MGMNNTDKAILLLTFLICVVFVHTLIVTDTMPLLSPERYRVSGTGSMRPVFYGGEIVSTREVTAYETMVVGDIYLIIYENKTEPVMHRLMAVCNGEYIFKGDFNLRPDEPVSRAQIQYKVIGVELD